MFKEVVIDWSPYYENIQLLSITSPSVINNFYVKWGRLDLAHCEYYDGFRNYNKTMFPITLCLAVMINNSYELQKLVSHLAKL